MEVTVKMRPELQLERILAALEQELIHADDEELVQAVAELGLKPSMKGSVALFGVTRVLEWPARTEAEALKAPGAQKKAPRIGDRRGS
jgi:hypothetical protein